MGSKGKASGGDQGGRSLHEADCISVMKQMNVAIAVHIMAVIFIIHGGFGVILHIRILCLTVNSFHSFMFCLCIALLQFCLVCRHFTFLCIVCFMSGCRYWRNKLLIITWQQVQQNQFFKFADKKSREKRRQRKCGLKLPHFLRHKDKKVKSWSWICTKSIAAAARSFK